MTVCDVSERTEIEALALELGWDIDKRAGAQTVCGYSDQALTVTWADGCATAAVITNASGQETARRQNYTWQTGSVSSWVRMMLRAIVTSRPAVPFDVEAGLREVLDSTAAFRPIAETLRPALEKREAQ